MGSFRFIEYTGKDSGKVLKGILTGKDEEVNVVDTRSHSVVGFQAEPQEPDEDEDDDDE
jgi:hypothetical protein